MSDMVKQLEAHTRRAKMVAKIIDHLIVTVGGGMKVRNAEDRAKEKKGEKGKAQTNLLKNELCDVKLPTSIIIPEVDVDMANEAFNMVRGALEVIAGQLTDRLSETTFIRGKDTIKSLMPPAPAQESEQLLSAPSIAVVNGVEMEINSGSNDNRD